MKGFDPLAFNYDHCRKELDEFGSLLQTTPELDEAADVLPFFRDRPQLSGLLGTFNPRMGWADRIAYEFDLFGDFACDVAVGEWASGRYCFVEFEDAHPTSVFRRQGKKATKEWATRFEHGFSQVVDWCYKLADRVNSGDFVARFGRHTVNFEAVLVIGRDHHLEPIDRLRLDWRTEHVVVNSKHVHCVTFDQLHAQLAARLSELTKIAEAERARRAGGTPTTAGE